MTDNNTGRSLFKAYLPKKSSDGTRRIERFGYSLGFSAKPWMVKYGAAWQFKLADVLVYEKGGIHKGIKVPRSLEMERRAREFLYHNKRLLASGRVLTDPEYQSRTGMVHHSLLDKTFNDVYRFQVVHGFRKVIDPNSRATIAKLKEEIKWAATPKEKRMFKSMLRDLEKSNAVPAWKIAATKAGVIPSTTDPAFKQRKAAVEALIKDRNIAIIKMQMAKLDVKDEMMFDKRYGGSDPGVGIGRGVDRKKEESDLYRLLKYLKRTRGIRGKVFDGIMKPSARRVRYFLRKHWGDKNYREFFLSYNARLKYATDAYFVPGSEYGYRKRTYDNKKGIISPLQRLRGFTKGGKEFIRRED